MASKIGEKKEEDDKPMIDNAELTTGDVGNIKLRISRNTHTSGSIRNSFSEANSKIHINDVIEKDNPKTVNNNNTINLSENNQMLREINLFPKGNIVNYNK